MLGGLYPEISLMMAKMTYGDQLEKLDQPFELLCLNLLLVLAV